MSSVEIGFLHSVVPFMTSISYPVFECHHLFLYVLYILAILDFLDRHCCDAPMLLISL